MFKRGKPKNGAVVGWAYFSYGYLPEAHPTTAP